MYLCWWTICPRGYLSFGIYTIMSSIEKDKTILAGTSPSIKRCHSVGSIRGTGSNRSVGAPRIVLRDINNMSTLSLMITSFGIRMPVTLLELKTVKSLYKIFTRIHSQTPCVPFLDVLQKIVKHAAFLSLKIHLLAI